MIEVSYYVVDLLWLTIDKKSNKQHNCQKIYTTDLTRFTMMMLEQQY